MSAQVTYSDAEVRSFVEALREFPDGRDNRGKRHALGFVVAAVVLAILNGRSKVSSRYRYIHNRLHWLREMPQQPKAQAISRAHLPRLLACLDWQALNTLIEQHFGLRVELSATQEWVAIDGKVLRGTLGGGDKQSVVLAVSHQSRTLLAQAPMKGSKASEIAVVRHLLKHTQLESRKVTLDAHHCNPKTTAQIHQAGGQYVIQIKENQPILFKQCQHLVATAVSLSGHEEADKGHGRITFREAQCFSLSPLHLAQRWGDSGLQTLVVIKRQTLTPRTGKSSSETAYYLSNQVLTPHSKAQAMEWAGAIRQHWHVESDNWIRDVTFQEDHIKTQCSNQAQIMGCLRSLAMCLLRKFNVGNFQEALETFGDCPSRFEAFLKRVKFL